MSSYAASCTVGKNTGLFQKMLKDADITYDKKYKDLSTGAKVKLQFACAMAHKPKLLILDEPTNGLDPVARLCRFVTSYIIIAQYAAFGN